MKMEYVMRRSWILLLFFGIAQAICAGGASETKQFEYDRAREVEINAGIFDVEIVGGSGTGVTVDVSDIPQGFRVNQRERNGSIAIDIQGRNTWFSRVTGDPTIRVAMPSGVDLDIKSVSGDVEVETIRGTVVIRTASGDIDLGSIGGDTRIDTASGEIALSEGTGTFEIDTASGDIDIDRFRGSFQISTSSGDVDIASLRLTADATVKTTSGDVSLDVENDLRDIRYDLKATSGDLRYGDTRAEGQLIRNTGRFHLEVSATSGDISVW